MKVRLLSSSVDGNPTAQFLTSFVINDTLAIDAGCVGLEGDPADQARIKKILISHLHMDHIASLPIFVENAFEAGRDGVTVLGSAAVLDGLRRHVFNDEVWPDMVSLSTEHRSFLKLQALEPGEAIALEGLTITPVEVDHVVPTLGFVVAEPGAAVVIASDTGPTEAIWRVANATDALKAVFLEATFPDAMALLAEVAKHLTPATFAREVAKLESQPRIIAVHLKQRFRRQVLEELEALSLPNLEIGTPALDYLF